MVELKGRIANTGITAMFLGVFHYSTIANTDTIPFQSSASNIQAVESESRTT